MKNSALLRMAFILLSGAVVFLSNAQKLDTKYFRNLKIRHVGPANMSGRITAIDVGQGDAMLLQLPKGATWGEVSWMVFLVFVAITALAAGLQGWLIRKTNFVERSLLVLSGALVIVPAVNLDAIGVGLLALVFVMQLLRRKPAKASP